MITSADYIQGCILHTVPAWKHAYKVRVAVFVEYESDVEQEKERVKKLLENLRIDAEIVVMYLADGQLQSYETIINGKPHDNPDVELILGYEPWWNELQKRRQPSAAPSHVIDISKLVGGSEWPQSSFQQGPKFDKHSERFRNLRNKIFKSKKRHIMSRGPFGLPFGNLRTPRLRPKTFSSDSELSDVEYSSDSSTDSVASAGDVEGSVLEDEDILRARKLRRASTGEALGSIKSTKHNTYNTFRHTLHKPSPNSTRRASDEAESSSSASASRRPPDIRPVLIHRVSSPHGHFTSKAIPDTRILTDEGGPSIGFADPFADARKADKLAGPIGQGEPGSPKAGLPSETSRPATAPTDAPSISAKISFNDLPAKAQHLILNELIKRYSEHTAVVFTTLPSPLAGTHLSEQDSVEYLNALEVSHQIQSYVMLESIFD